MACDGEIATEEVALVKNWTANNPELFGGMDVELTLNNYVDKINEKGMGFLSEYIKDVAEAELSEDQQLQLIRVAIRMIEADYKIEYSEISFFKKIRGKLQLTDEKILDLLKSETLFEKFPEVKPDDFLLPDIIVKDSFDWNVSFENIKL